VAEDRENSAGLQLPDATAPDSRLAMEFLRELASRDPGRKLITICVKQGEGVGSMTGRTFDIDQEAAALRAHLVDKEDRKETNVYFALNGVRLDTSGVPSDGDIALIRGAMIDIDLLPTVGPSAWAGERERIKALVRDQVMALKCKPTFIIDSGNGCQLGWMYNQPVPVTAQSAALVLAIEQALQPLFLGGDKATTRNIKNLFRVPGTVNHPSRSKIDRGAKAECFSGLWFKDGPLYDPAELQAWVDSVGQPPPQDDTGSAGNAEDLGLDNQTILDVAADPSKLGQDLKVRLENIAHTSAHVRAYISDNHDSVAKGDRSGADFRFCVILLQNKLTPASVALCLAAHGSDKKEERSSPQATVRYIVNTVLKAQREHGKENPDDWPEQPKTKPEEKPYGEDIRGFRFATGTQANAKPLNDQKGLVRGLLGSTGLSMVIGPPNTGKSAWCLLLGLAVVNGVQFDGKETSNNGGLVVYAAAEGAGGFDKRVKALAIQHPGLDLSKLGILDGHFDVYTNVGARLLAWALKDIQEKYGRIDLVVLDTLTAVSPGAKESSDDLKAVILNLERIAALFDCHVQFIHHTGKDISKGARGWSGLLGAVDTEIMINRNPDRPTIGTYRVTKQRDLILDDAERWYQLQSVTVGTIGEHVVIGVALEFIEPIKTEDEAPDAQAILTILKEAGKPVALAYVFDKRMPFASIRNRTKGAIKMLLDRLFKKGLVYREKIGVLLYSVAVRQGDAEFDEEDNDPFAL